MLLTAIVIIEMGFIGVLVLERSAEPFAGTQVETGNISYSEQTEHHPFQIRKLDENLTYILEPNTSIMIRKGQHFKPIEPYHVETNSQGFRDEEFRPGTDGKTVMVLGDSQIYGWGVNESYRFTEVLETRLEDEGNDLEVYNMGVPGLGMREYYIELERYGEKYNPDTVVVVFSRNDVFNVKISRDIYNRAEEMAPEDVNNTGAWAREKNIELRREFKDRTTISNSTIPEYMEKIDRTGQELGADVIFYSIRPDPEIESFASNLTETRESRYISAPEKFRELEFEEYHVASHDAHLNELGHRLLAEKLAREMDET